MSKTYVEYSSNNSGGSWWLKDEDWKKLEAAGWEVIWGTKYFCHDKYQFMKRPGNKPDICPEDANCPGHRRFDSFEDAAKDRYLGAVAKSAVRRSLSLGDAIREWEKVTGQDSSDLGCSCCGTPHSFTLYTDEKYVESYSPDYPAQGSRYAQD